MQKINQNLINIFITSKICLQIFKETIFLFKIRRILMKKKRSNRKQADEKISQIFSIVFCGDEKI
jgi:hypothetical protein